MSGFAWLSAAVAAGVAAAVFALLSLSAGTAYGTEFHNLSARQRVMARMLYIGSLLLAIVLGCCAAGMAAWAVHLLLA